MEKETNLEHIVLYGCGAVCKKVLPYLQKKYRVEAVIDRNSDLWGAKILEIPIISLNQYLSESIYKPCKIVLTVDKKHIKSIERDLLKQGVKDFIHFYDYLYGDSERELLLSCADPMQFEDVILYNVFHDDDDVYYIDVGSNDPIQCSVTKLLYDMKNARGINIEPQEELIDYTSRIRKRDINICMGLGNREETVDFYIQGGMSTVLKKNKTDDYYEETRSIQLTTLEKICDQYLPEGQKISFLKIDVEGLEREVLEGANFQKYRPIVVVMEATLPRTMIKCHEDWEDILINNHYHHVFSYGVNRYYVADECDFLNEKFISVEELYIKYQIVNVFAAG